MLPEVIRKKPTLGVDMHEASKFTHFAKILITGDEALSATCTANIQGMCYLLLRALSECLH